MSPGTWLVLCSAERTISLADLAERLHGRKGLARVELDGALVATVRDALSGRDVQVTVGLSTESHVPLEAAELAGRHPDASVHDRLAALDARYELLWDLRDSDEVYNTLAVIAGILETTCDGVIYDATTDCFV
jgi:hypothetical protein